MTAGSRSDHEPPRRFAFSNRDTLGKWSADILVSNEGSACTEADKNVRAPGNPKLRARHGIISIADCWTIRHCARVSPDGMCSSHANYRRDCGR